jgi:cystathionine gamma-lyase
MNMDVTFVYGWRTEEIEAAIRDNTAMIILESPGTATFTAVDFKAVSELAKSRNIVTYTDNSYCSPVFQKPLTMGIDIVMHSVTKYLGGHSDLLGGVLVTSNDEIIEKLATQKTWFGGIMGPMEAWLLMRGLRTLELRMKAHQETAMQVAKMLAAHPKVKKVYYPGLPDHPQAELIKRQQTGSSGLMSFEVKGTVEDAQRVVDSLKVFEIGPSWGGFESLVVMPLAHHSEEYAEWYGADRGLIRIHCGLEGAEILMADLEQALG